MRLGVNQSRKVSLNNQEIAQKNFDEFQKALNKDLIRYQMGELHKDLIVFSDSPNGEHRITYGLKGSGSRLKASCVAVLNDSFNGKTCFDVGVATFKKFRQQGHGKLILEKAISELKHGLSMKGIDSFYVELKVDRDNEASHKLCRPFADEAIEKEDATIYIKLVT